jgi:transcriptional regulator with XRE-family HTH domain
MSMTQAQAKKLGALIASARKQRGLSLRGLAAATGIDHSWIGYLESGQYRDPAGDRLATIAQVLGIETERIDYLSKGAVQAGLPQPDVYFRAKYGLTPEKTAQAERYIEELRGQA